MSTEFWEIPVDTSSGRPLAAPTRVVTWEGFHYYNLTSSLNGKTIAVVKWRSQGDVYLGEKDKTGNWIASPRRLTYDSSIDMPAGWVDHGRSLVFRSDRRGTYDLFKISLDGGSPVPLAVGPKQEWFKSVTTDGDRVLYEARSSEPELRWVSASGGPSEEILRLSADQFTLCAPWNPEHCLLGEWIDNKLTFFDFDPSGGKGRALVQRNDLPLGMAVSPDGKMLALRDPTDTSRIIVVDLETGTNLPDVVIEGWGEIAAPVWGAEGETLWVASRLRPPAVRRVGMDGHATPIWQMDGARSVGAMSPSPTGDHVAFFADMRESSVWIIEDF
jgi:Tol biopolymer transport system component